MPDLSKFRSGVSLHGHTLYSNESLRFLHAFSRHSRVIRLIMAVWAKRYATFHGVEPDLKRIWWTPPLGPQQALALETAQLEQLGVMPLVSLTDHDSIQAPLMLRAIDSCSKAPISIEWTVPYFAAELHVGIHNMPPEIAVDLAQMMAEYTRNPEPSPAPILERISRDPGTLVVLNHPLWDEIGIGKDIHIAAVQRLLQTCGRFIHALEWNGLRCADENTNVVQLASTWSKPVVSGGDRHGFEPNSVLNLTNASSFPEFVEEVRDGASTLILTNTYFQKKALRIWQTVREVFSSQPDHPRGWTLWTDRVFYAPPGSGPMPLTALWRDDPPLIARGTRAALEITKQFPLTYALNLREFRAGCKRFNVH